LKIGTNLKNGTILKIGTNLKNGTIFELEEISKMEQITNWNKFQK
jgi:hypothetical protein